MSDSPRPLFDLGRVVATPGALDALRPHDGFLSEIIARHVRADWGGVDAEDAQANDRALRDGSRVVSAYTTPAGVRLWVITEADRSSTCVLTPEEY